MVRKEATIRGGSCDGSDRGDSVRLCARGSSAAGSGATSARSARCAGSSSSRARCAGSTRGTDDYFNGTVRTRARTGGARTRTRTGS